MAYTFDNRVPKTPLPQGATVEEITQKIKDLNEQFAADDKKIAEIANALLSL